MTVAVQPAVRCAVYLRISLDQTGEQLAVQRQRSDCNRIARSRGWVVVEEYSDNSISAYDRHKKRPSYDRMVADYAAGRFDAVICYDLDRLTRQPRQLEDWIEQAEERGLQLVTANGECDFATDAGRLFARMKAAVARAEVERKSARQKSAAAQRAELGRWAAGPWLLGYVGKDARDRANRPGELIPEQADLVREMFNRFASGESLNAIARWLQESGVPTRRGAPWNPSSVRTLLTNPRYTGRSVLRGQAVSAGDWPAVVSADLFDTVNAKLADPRRKTQVGTDRKHLGSALYRCGVCGTPLRSHSRSYRCKVGGHVMRMRESIDGYVLTAVLKRLARPDLRRLLTAPDTAEGITAAGELTRLQARLGRIERDYDDDLIDGNRYQTARSKVLAELAAIQMKIARTVSTAGAAGVLSAADPVRAFAEAPLGTQRSVMEFLVTVTLLPGTRGHKWNPQCEECVASVAFDWRTAA